MVVALAVIILVIDINLKTKSAKKYEPVFSPIIGPDITTTTRTTRNQEIPKNEPMFPKGLYSSRGIGWESYTKERLESELHRSAAAGEDLVFMVMQARKAKFGEETFRKLANEGVAFFTERDMVFERGEQGISLIVPSLNLDQGLAKSEQFRRHINNSMTDASGAGADLCAGLTSRSGRLVEADRFILEASEALSRAMKDPTSSIIAFRSNPEKYREYISQTEDA
jgi:hypothetical protein